ncbi:MAG TPA: radical SAM protein [Thermoplasmatales archaeon]|nr:radical SAM protein [Thermoplasmatales archaeon]
MPRNSFYTKKLAKGCQLCQKGAKLVLLITGLCMSKCFYCPLSEKKRDRDVIYANEMLVKNYEDVINEAELIEAEGTGITGGDPIIVVERVENVIKILKDYFGENHHIHLYTSTLDYSKINRIEESGLDEIRFHPPVEIWSKIERTDFRKLIDRVNIDKGIEIPLIPHLKNETLHLLKNVDKYGIDFINLNELEFSITNLNTLDSFGYVAKNDISSAVKGSEEMAYEIKNIDLDTPIHYCSSSFKDAIQLRKRIERRAKNTAKIYELITEDGTLLKGIIIARREKLKEIKEEFEIDENMISWNEEKKRIETSPFIIEEIAEYLPYKCYIVEEYPTADKLEVERTPLN